MEREGLGVGCQPMEFMNGVLCITLGFVGLVSVVPFVFVFIILVEFVASSHKARFREERDQGRKRI